MSHCVDHEVITPVLVKTAMCPRCGPRSYATCDDCDKLFRYPVVVDVAEFAGGSWCECGEIVLLDMEPVPTEESPTDG